MPERAENLHRALTGARRMADRAQSEFLNAEQLLAELEEREARQAQRDEIRRAEMSHRFPALERGV